MATLSKISSMTGLSVATVSRILNNDLSLSVKDETRKKVLEVAEKLEYKVKERNESKLFNFDVVFTYDEALEITDPYYLSIRISIIRECQNLKIHLNKFYNFNTYKESNSDGLLAVGYFSKEQKKILSKNVENIFFIDTDTYPYYDCIIPDLSAISKTMIDYFISRKHKTIGYIGARDFDNIVDEREDAFISYAKIHNIFDNKYLYIGKFSSASGYEMAKKMLSEKNIPNALFIANDSIAIGVLKALNEYNISIPSQIEIISINDIPSSSFTYPALTTVKISSDFMGSQAVRLLRDRILSKRKIPIKVIVPFSIIFRETTF